MANFKFVVLSNPVQGQDEDYNAWYSDVHIRDVVDTPGFVGAQRFALAPVDGDNCSYRYLAIYEMTAASADEAADAVKGLFARGRGGEMDISPALDTSDILSGVFKPIEGGRAP